MTSFKQSQQQTSGEDIITSYALYEKALSKVSVVLTLVVLCLMSGPPNLCPGFW